MSADYESIARFYDVDMARNMPYDDVEFYAGICTRRPGRVLELGCGTGRILLDLMMRNVDAFGVDASAAMLAELARAAARRGLPLRAARMDITALGLAPGLATVLCPYSLVTYLSSAQAVDRLFAAVHALLRPDGCFVVDAFIPRQRAGTGGWQADYRRRWGDGTLARWKRITPLDGERNRIERRYEVACADGQVRETVNVMEVIRPIGPVELADRLAAAGFAAVETCWDYGQPAPAREVGAQFATCVATRG